MGNDREYNLLDVKDDIDKCTSVAELRDIEYYLDIVYMDFPEFLEPMCRSLIEYYIRFRETIIRKEILIMKT